MLGGVIMVVFLVVLFPVGFLMSMAVVAAVLGGSLKQNAETIHADSELLDTNY